MSLGVADPPKTKALSAASPEANRAVAGTIALGVLQTLGRVLALVFVLVATRVLAPDQFGRYSIVAGLVAFAGFVADFGSTTVITRVVSREPESSDGWLSETLVASVVVGCTAYGAILAYVWLGPYPSGLLLAAAVGGFAVPGDAALTSMLAALDGHGLISRRALVTFVRLAVMTVGGGLGVLVTRTVAPAMIALALGPLCGLVLALVFIRRHRVWTLRLHPSWSRSMELFRTALPYALMGGIGAVVARLDLLVLSLLSSTGEVARYDLAVRATEAVTSLGLVIGAPALFFLSKRLGQGDHDGVARAYAHAVRVTYLVGIPASCVFVALSGPIARIAFGPRYASVGPLVAILGVGVWMAILGGLQSAVVLAGGFIRPALRVTLSFLLTAVVLDAALIPTLHATGAAIATVATSLVVCIVFEHLNRRTVRVETGWPEPMLLVSCAIGTVLMGGCVLLGAPWLAVALLPVLPAMLLATRVVSVGDIRRLVHMVTEGNRV